MTILRIATRRSALALAQTRWVGAQIRSANPDVEIEELHIVTEGDRVLDRSLADIGGKGLFVTEVEAALIDGRADVAVHSMKDLPATLGEGLVLGAIPLREDAHDVLVTANGVEIDELPAGSTIGTGSIRRITQLRRHRNDLRFEPLRGNVDTRLKRLAEGRFAGIVLAAAGLNRLGVSAKSWRLPVETCVPAIGQGALAIEARGDAPHVHALLRHLDDQVTRFATTIERTVLLELGGDCHAAIACYARFTSSGSLRVDARVAHPRTDEMIITGSERYVSSHRERDAIAIGKDVSKELIDSGAKALMDAAKAQRSN